MTILLRDRNVAIILVSFKTGIVYIVFMKNYVQFSNNALFCRALLGLFRVFVWVKYFTFNQESPITLFCRKQSS